METGLGDDSNAALNLGDCIAAAQCLKAISYDLVDRALIVSDRTARRLGKFPDHLVVYHAIFMALYMDSSYLHVFEMLQNTLGWLSGSGLATEGVTNSAITQARQRLGVAPLRELFKLVAKPLGKPNSNGAFFKDLRLMLIDGTMFDVPDTAENAILGKRTNQHGSSYFPQVRAVALIEASTRLVVDLELGPFKGSGEKTLANSIFSRMDGGILCLADRYFPGTDLCRLVIEKGSHFLWRAKAERAMKLTPLEKLSDGSFLANLSQTREDSLTVRVIEYTLDGKKDVYRLVTSLLDEQKYPANELAKLYPHRWEAETFYKEIKQVLRAPKVILRSKSPDGVYQEIYGLFLAHYVVRAFMMEAAEEAGIPPDTLSFNHSVRVLRNNLPNFGNFFP